MINNLTQYLTRSASKRPNKLAVISGKTKLTYDELFKKSQALAHYFQEQGIMSGDRVVIALGNKIETIICFWAALYADAVISIIDHMQDEQKIDYIIQDSGASIFISDKDVTGMARLTSKDIQFITSKPSSNFVKPNNLDIDLASIIYTSGSTGEPKGVMLTHRNMLAAEFSINSYLQNDENDSIISALPLSFDYGLYQMIMMVFVTGTLILEENFLLPSHFLKLIELYKPTALPLVPSMVSLFRQFNQLKQYDLSSIRYVTNTGAALMETHIASIKEIFKSAKVFSMYGLTECKRCTYLPPEDIDKKTGSIGIPIPNTQMWIADSEGKKLGPNQIGEIVVRGQTVMKGYWNKPEITKKKLKDGLLPGEFILFTGDFGQMDEDGYFYFQDRMDEVIKSRGMKVSPKEIETKIVSHKDIIEVVAVGVEHDAYGQALVLFVSTTNPDLTEVELSQFCKSNLQAHQQPVEILIYKNLPKTTNGKLNKRALKEDYQKKLNLAA